MKSQYSAIVGMIELCCNQLLARMELDDTQTLRAVFSIQAVFGKDTFIDELRNAPSLGIQAQCTWIDGVSDCMRSKMYSRTVMMEVKGWMHKGIIRV